MLYFLKSIIIIIIGWLVNLKSYYFKILQFLKFWEMLGSKSMPGSGFTRIPGEVPDQFPAGLRVLVVDDDITCLTILEKMLRTCSYRVTKTNRAEIALSWLLENKNGFDIVISDVHMPDMDGFKLLERVGLELDLPVIMMSADDSKHVVMQGITHGACDYLIKPVRIEALQNIWQHVVRKKRNEWKDFGSSGSWDESDQQQKQDEAVSSLVSDGGWKNSKRKGEDEENEEKDDSGTLKKPRVVWSVELHQQFVAAVNQLGIDKAVPKKILELMNVPGLTRENVASHLQKYRLYLRRLSGVSQHQAGLNNSFMAQESGFNTVTPLGNIDLQTLAATGQLSAQTLAAYTRMTPSIKPGMSMPFVDQRNLFSFENCKVRYGEGQQLSNTNKQINLLHGIPTTMEPKQLVGLNRSTQTMGGMNHQASASSGHQSSSLVMPMIPQQSRVQSSIGQSVQSNGMSSGAISRNGIGYNPVSQAGSIVDFSVNQISDLQGSGIFPLRSTPASSSSATSKGFNQDESSSEVKVTRGYTPSYDMFSDLQQHKSQEWQSPNPGMTFGGSSQQATSVQNNLNVAPSVLVSQTFIPYQKNGQNENTFTGKPMFSAGVENQPLGTQSLNQNINGLFVDNLSRVKVERVSEVVGHGGNLFSEHYGQEDLMSALLKQQQGVASGEFDFDGYTLDNIPV